MLLFLASSLVRNFSIINIIHFILFSVMNVWLLCVCVCVCESECACVCIVIGLRSGILRLLFCIHSRCYVNHPLRLKCLYQSLLAIGVNIKVTFVSAECCLCELQLMNVLAR